MISIYVYDLFDITNSIISKFKLNSLKNELIIFDKCILKIIKGIYKINKKDKPYVCIKLSIRLDGKQTKGEGKSYFLDTERNIRYSIFT